MTKHYEELDSLRGLGAFTVIWCHLLGCLPYDTAQNKWWHWLFENTPLAVLRAGNEGIVFFFLLSGFVLSISFLGDRKPPHYLAYLAKRIFRLYPTYIISVFVAYLVKSYCYQGDIPGYSEWVNHLWGLSGGWKIFASHFPLITQFKTAHFNPPVWSLVVEMRISLIFPLLMVLFFKFKNRTIISAVAFSILCGFVALHFKESGHERTWASVFRSLSFVGYFALGIFLANGRKQLIAKVTSLSQNSRRGLLLAGALFYTNDLWLYSGLNTPPLTNFFTGIGASIFLVLAISKRSFLSHGVVHFFGKISYSMYLWHTVLIYGLASTLYPYFSVWQMGILVFAGTVAVSVLSYHLIELPSMKAGRSVSRAITGWQEGSPLKTREPAVAARD